MKKKLLLTSILTLSLAIGVGAVASSNANRKEANADTQYEGGVTYLSSVENKAIDTHDDTESEIKSYYDDLNDLSASERKGQKLLKHLKPILQNGSYFVNYDNIRYWYLITERDWIQSPLGNPESVFNFKEPTTIKAHVLYRTTNGESNASDYDTSFTTLNREHLWVKSRGFQAKYETTAPGTDIHHLILADENINSTSHNNYPYGDAETPTINPSTKITDTYDPGAKGYRYYDTANHLWFEPMDFEKGDIARAVLYMAARYNNIAGINMAETTKSGKNVLLSEANLTLNNWDKNNYSREAAESLSNTVIDYGDLATLLRWHKLDPVSDFEIHRNNLIDNNFQHNRNPFIDYPEWVDYIWGDSEGYAQPNTDTISQYGKTGAMTITGSSSVSKNSTTNLNVNITGITGNETILWSSSDESVATINSNGVVSGVKEGTATIKAITKDSTFYTEKIIQVTNSPVISVTGVSLNKEATSLEESETETLTATVEPSNATNKNVSWSSSDETVANIDNGTITALKEGTANITVTTEDGSFTDTCEVTVTKKIEPVAGFYTLSFDGNTSDVSTSLTTANFLTNNKIHENNLVESVTTVEKLYKGVNGLKFGTSSAVGVLTANVYSGAGKNIESITITSTQYGSDTGKFKLTINDSTVLSSEITPGEDYTYTFDEPTNISNFTLETTSNRAYLGSITLTPKAEISPTSVTLNKDETTIVTSLNERLTAVVEPENAANKNVTWASSNENVVTVEDGLLTAVAKGTATITVRTEVGNCSDTCSVIVEDAPAGKFELVFSNRDIDSNAQLAANDFLNEDIDSNSMVSEVTAVSYCYHGKNGIKFGNSSNPGSFTGLVSTSAQTKVKQIIISSSKYGSETGTLSIFINNSAQAIATFNPADGLSYVFTTATNITSFKLSTSSKRAYVKSITFITEDKYAVNTFVSTYMHMDDYDPELTGVGDGSCLGENGYYMTAKNALMLLSENQIIIFRTDADYANAKTRYETWADAYGDSTPYETDVTPSNLLKTIEKGDAFVATITIIAGLSSLSILFILVFKKKKYEQ